MTVRKVLRDDKVIVYNTDADGLEHVYIREHGAKRPMWVYHLTEKAKTPLRNHEMVDDAYKTAYGDTPPSEHTAEQDRKFYKLVTEGKIG